MKPGIRKIWKNKLIIIRPTNATQFSTEIEVLYTIIYIVCVLTKSLLHVERYEGPYPVVFRYQTVIALYFDVPVFGNNVSS